MSIPGSWPEVQGASGAGGLRGYPVYVAFGYLFLAGYIARTIFLSLRLPGVLGGIVVGMIFSSFMQEDILQCRDLLQESAFFLVLLKAGLEISLRDLNLGTLICAWLPLVFELLGLTGYSMYVKTMTVVEALVLGTALCGLGEGLVIPKMNEFGRAFPEHPMPKLVFTCAPLEASFVLTAFGILQGFAKPKGGQGAPMGPVIMANFLRIILTLVFGAVLGGLSGLLIPRRVRISVFGRQVFTGAAVEAFLLFLSISLLAFGLGKDRDDGFALVPMGFAPGSLFTPELLVITVGASFSAMAAPEELHEVESILGGLWIFGQIVLFSMLGSKTAARPFREFPDVLPLMLTGFLFRGLGACISFPMTHRLRVCSRSCSACKEANRRSARADILFYFLSTLPRATLQGALASVPLREGFFGRDASAAWARQFISDAGRIYIPFLAITGSIIVDLLGPRLLRISEQKAERHVEARNMDREAFAVGWRPRLQSAASWRSASASDVGANSPRLDPLNAFEACVDTSSFGGVSRPMEAHQPLQELPSSLRSSRGGRSQSQD